MSSALPFAPTTELASQIPSFSYQVYLSATPEIAAEELDADPRQAVRSCAQLAKSPFPSDFLRHNDTFLGPWVEWEKQRNLTEIPVSGIMERVVEDYMVEAYEKQGFYNSKRHPIHSYIHNTVFIFFFSLGMSGFD
jgi:hypothetical protein